MPELPDIEAYIAALRARVLDHKIERATVINPFVLRSVEPGFDEIEGHEVEEFSRIGKRIVLHLDGDLHVVIHLMVAGRLRWLEDKPGASARRADLPRISLLALRFDNGVLVLTEAGTKKQASVHIVGSREGLGEHDPGGIEPLASSLEEFAAALRRENHTVKRALTLPRLIAGIGNAFSDEILHAACLSPLKLTNKLTDDELARLFDHTRALLTHWTSVLSERYIEEFPGPGEVTAFRKEFAAHGKFGEPCPACAENIERIRYADNETNYCPTCQTAGKLLADRSMSRLLKADWGKQEAEDS